MRAQCAKRHVSGPAYALRSLPSAESGRNRESKLAGLTWTHLSYALMMDRRKLSVQSSSCGSHAESALQKAEPQRYRQQSSRLLGVAMLILARGTRCPCAVQISARPLMHVRATVHRGDSDALHDRSQRG